MCVCVYYTVYIIWIPFETHAYDTCAEPGDKVAIDEPIAQIETDKVVFQNKIFSCL